ncbi:hypothetical protein RP20_CCG017110 [Aedes albopictus]|nr:hypothetical protein RP20_CCG017110 [Aedes albopictus]
MRDESTRWRCWMLVWVVYFSATTVGLARVDGVFVNARYVIAVGYVLADTTDKSRKQYAKPEILGGGARGAAIASGDTLLWQMFASVIIPGFTINRICWLSKKVLSMNKVKGPLGKWAPTALGLLAIPFIIHPIDHGVDLVVVYENWME